MQIPIIKYGYREVFLAAVVLGLLGLGLGLLSHWLLLVPAILFVWVLSFFRNPRRTPPGDAKTIVSPADGKIIFIGEVDEPNFIGGKALRIGIFLSVFNAHINRAPLGGTVTYLKYTEGEFVNALSDKSSEVNENNLIGIVCEQFEDMKILVRQVSGAIARRIVCDVKEEQNLERGEIMGMIKFGSRTDLYLPLDIGNKLTLSVKVQDTVKAGISVLGVLP